LQNGRSVPSAPKSPTLSSRGDAACKRVLLLDDEESILTPVSRYLREIGYLVVVTREPEEAQAVLDVDSFDLVIMDLALTRFGQEGLEVLGWIRYRHPFLPVIVLSANISPEVAEDARRLRADAVLCKPQPLAELARVAASVMECES
jgi:DNA-binding response OmpR family regulator